VKGLSRICSKNLENSNKGSPFVPSAISKKETAKIESENHKWTCSNSSQPNYVRPLMYVQQDSTYAKTLTFVNFWIPQVSLETLVSHPKVKTLLGGHIQGPAFLARSGPMGINIQFLQAPGLHLLVKWNEKQWKVPKQGHILFMHFAPKSRP